MPTLFVPPSTARPPGPLHRALAHAGYAGGFVLTVSASVLMLGSAALAGAAGASVSLSERLRERALGLLGPAAAVAFRARETFYERRRQGQELD